MASFLGTITGIIISLIFGPTLGFLEGWVMGWFTKLIIGDWIVEGLSYLNIIITSDNIPMIFGVIGAIAVFFTYGIKTAINRKDN